MSRSEVLLPKYETKGLFSGFGTGFTVFGVLILALWRLFLVDRRYCCQDTGETVHSAVIETGFIAFAVLILALWGILLVDLMYLYKDTGENGHSPSLKLVLRYSLF